MKSKLQGKVVAILVADGFEQSELEEPRRALERAGAVAKIVSPNAKEVKGWQSKDWGDTFDVDVHLSDAHVSEYDALLLPGGVINPDTLKQDEKAVAFARGFFEAGKPVAAICHGPWLLVDAEVLRGRTLTSFPSIKNDLMNAGAKWVNEEVHVDRGLVTSRKPSDIPAFNKKMIEEFAEGPHAGQAALSPGQRRSRADV